MGEGVVSLPTAGELLQFVHAALCGHDRLDPEQSPCRRAALRRRGRVCGGVFHVEGPRLVRPSAVWAGEEHRIMFYDSSGTRVREVRLSDSPDPAEVFTTEAAA